MPIWLHVGAGLLAALAGWSLARIVAGAWRIGPMPILAHDLLVPVASFFVLLLASGRPLFSGIVAFAAFGGFAFADHIKRITLREPIVFTDMSEARELIRHPEFYLPFAGGWLFLAAFGAVLACFAAVFLLDPPIFEPSILGAVSIFVGAILAVLICAFPLVGPWARLLRRFGPTGDPMLDAKNFGPFAMIGVYGIIARAERPWRRAQVKPQANSRRRLMSHPPVVIVQNESFFDIRQIHPSMPPDLLPEFDKACRTGSQWGELSVRCWGANTTRTEFAVLSGLSESGIGFDGFNPYHAFVRQPVDTIAWKLRNEGYRTICIHPFDPDFYYRRRVMPALGFDIMVGDSLYSQNEAAHVPDTAVANFCSDLLSEHRHRPVLLFVMTMQNHGPWPRHPGEGRLNPLPKGDNIAPELPQFDTYLDNLRCADQMICTLTKSLERDGRDGIFAFYGDHQPSFPRIFSEFGFRATNTNYFIWRPNSRRSLKQPIAAHSLCAAVLNEISSLAPRPDRSLHQSNRDAIESDSQ